jgi:hypothetical protein
MAHQSDSAAQHEAESLIRDKLSQTLGVGLNPRSVKLGKESTVQVDGCAADESVFVEIFAHQGLLKGGQKHKVKGDALKLISLTKGHPSARLILAFGNEEAARYALDKSWVAEAIRLWGIEVFVVELEPDARDGLRAAQARQVMVNPAPPVP